MTVVKNIPKTRVRVVKKASEKQAEAKIMVDKQSRSFVESKNIYNGLFYPSTFVTAQ